MKIALYKTIGGSILVNDACDWIENDNDYIRFTEVIDIDFVDLPKEEVVPKQVQQIENRITEARVKFHQAIEVLEEQKSKLLAIEDQS